MLRLSLFLAGSMCMDDADVQTLIDRLGDERYAVRARAQTHLEQVLLSGSGHIHRHIVEAALDNPDLEIARRARAALDLYYNIAPSTYPVLPWIDMLPPNYPGRQILIESCLFQVRTPGAWDAARARLAVVLVNFRDRYALRRHVRVQITDLPAALRNGVWQESIVDATHSNVWNDPAKPELAKAQTGNLGEKGFTLEATLMANSITLLELLPK